MLYSIEDLVTQTRDYSPVSKLVIATEIAHGGYSRERIIETMKKNLVIIKQSIVEGIVGIVSATGLTGGDAIHLNDCTHSGNFSSGETILQAVRDAIAVSEVNAKMGLIYATPTVGNAGVVSGVLLAVIDCLKLTHQQQLDFSFTVRVFSLVIVNNASISSVEGGCQAEVGSASAMAGAALVTASGGTPDQPAQVVATMIKNMMGLIYDPTAGLTEVPCVKRDVSGSSQAFISANMALVGIRSIIPPDEVIHAMYQVGRQMLQIFKETVEGGPAVTLTA